VQYQRIFGGRSGISLVSQCRTLLPAQPIMPYFSVTSNAAILALTTNCCGTTQGPP